MRGKRSSRKTISLTEGSPRLDVSGASSSSQHSFWVVNNDGHPKSPVSIERFPPSHERKRSKVARVKPFGKAVARKRRNHPVPQESFPFFIDKSPAKEMVGGFLNHRRSFMNDSVIVIESPKVNKGASVASSEWPVEERRRQCSVDTVDLCSDEEDCERVLAVKDKRKKKREAIPKKRRKLCIESQECHQPDVIVLDDEDESIDQSSNRNASIIAEATTTSVSHLCAPTIRSTVSPTEERCSDVTASSGGGSKFWTKYKDKASAMEVRLNQGEVPSANPGSSKDVRLESNPQLSNTVGSNVFNPCGSVQQCGLRPIIIDGCNVAIAHGGNRMFSVRGLCICVEYFVRRGHKEVVALVPLHLRSKVSHQDRDVLESLKNDGHLVFTPSRYIDNRLISSYDDRYIVQYAAAVGGVVVSRDNYRDLLIENPAWRDTITNRLLMPTWVGDILMFPVDPLGKAGPSLDDFLRFPDE